MEHPSAFSPISFFAGVAVGVVLMLVLKRGFSRANVPGSPLPPLTGDLETDVRTLLEAERKIEAIKLVRNRTGCGLKEAKDEVEAVEKLLKS